MIELLRDKVKVWRTPESDLYADVLFRGRWKTVPLAQENLFRGVMLEMMQAHAIVWPGREVMEELAAYFEQSAATTLNVEAANLRLAEKEGAVWYDLGADDGTKVRFQTGKWSYVKEKGPKFVLGQGMLEQKMAVRGAGKLPDLLSPFITVRNEHDMALLIAWLVGCFKPGGPFPVLVINGEQGSAKSTTTKVLRRIVDPHTRAMRGPPRDERDFATAVRNGYVVAFDNVSNITAQMSDTLCTLAYGDRALGGRALYSDYNDAAFTAVRPVILNGITDFVLRGDLMERSICLHLPQIQKRDRVDDDTFWQGFEEALPGILGALYDIVAAAHLNFPYTTIPGDMRIRMANFCRWAVAGEPATSFETGTLLKALNRNDSDNAVRLMEYDAVGMALVDMMKETVVFHGDLQQLNNELVKYRRLETKGYWPETARAMSGNLKMLKGYLRRFGIEVYENGHNAKTRRAMWEIRRSVPSNAAA